MRVPPAFGVSVHSLAVLIGVLWSLVAVLICISLAAYDVAPFHAYLPSMYLIWGGVCSGLLTIF